MAISFLYQKTGRFFAQVAGQSEETAAQELLELGIPSVRPVYRGVEFEGEFTHLMTVNYASRTVSKVIAPLASFQAHKERILYKRALQLPWEALIHGGETIAVFANTSNSKITHSHYAALLIKDAICDRLRDLTGSRPRVDRANPDVAINLFLHNNHATVGVDTSGGPLFKRGYRVRTVKAPMQETVGGIIARHVDWDGTTPLYDLMAGSGTMLLECAMHGWRIPPGFLRKRFGFERLPEFNKGEFTALKAHLNQKIRTPQLHLLHACDIDRSALDACTRNARVLFNGLPRVDATLKREAPPLHFTNRDFRALGELHNAVLLVNPPWGQRLERREELAPLYEDLGNFFKRNCTGSTAYLYVGDRSLLKHVGLRPSFKKIVVSGNMEGRLARYELY